MLVSKKWLNEYVDIVGLSDDELEKTLTGLGLEVEGIKTSASLDEKLVVGEIIRADRHPNADSLQVCLVNVGTSEPLQIVCGASNARAGIKVAVAMVGCVLPGEFKIKESKIRQEKSFGMLCSEEELGLAEKSAGILELSQEKIVGTKVNSFIDTSDSVFEISITPNRADCNGVIGIARDLAAKLGKKICYPLSSVQSNQPLIPTREKVKLELDQESGCQRFTALYISGITNGSSPLWLKKRLEQSGMRPLNLIVDLTNYVMLEYNQPIHAYDERSVIQRQIIVRRGKKSDRLVTLDGKEIQPEGEDILICDPTGPIGLAGIMGGQNSEVKSDTTAIILEVAAFDPRSIRRTSKRYNYHTEASHGFERGVDVENLITVAKRFAHLLVQCSLEMGVKAPKLEYEILDHYPKPHSRLKVALRLDRARKLLGLNLLSADTCIKHLTSLEFKHLDKKDERHLFEVPSWRIDISKEVDLIEEVARLESLDKIPYRMPIMDIAPVKENPFIEFVDEAKGVLATLGLTEVITYPFTSLKDYENLLVSENHPLFPSVNLANPLVTDHSWMQTFGIIGLLKATERNHRQLKKGARLFEFGKGFHDFTDKALDKTQFPLYAALDRNPLHFTRKAQTETTRPVERHLASFLLDYPFNSQSWMHKETAPSFFDGKLIVETLLKSFGIKNAIYERPSSAELPFVHPSASAVIKIGHQAIGWIGELHPTVGANFGFESEKLPVIGEIELEAVFQSCSEKLKIEAAYFEFPPAIRDLAFFVDQHISHGDVLRATNTFIRKKNLKSVQLFDVYKGEHTPTGKKSMAYTLEFRSVGKTLTDQDVEKELKAYIEWLTSQLGAEQR